MTDFDPTNDNDLSRPGCEPGQAALQRFLDGEADWDTPDASAHRAACVACRDDLAFARSIRQLTPPPPPVNLGPLLLTAVVSDHRRRRFVRLAVAWAALAASVVIAVIAFRPSNNAHNQPNPEVVVAPKSNKAPTPEPPRPIGDSVAEARDAIVTLTKRTASETRDGSARLLVSPKLPDLPDTGDNLEPLADAGSGAAKSFEPVASSARRAVNFFLRPGEPPARQND